MTCAEIGQKYNVSGTAIQKINDGSNQRQEGITYPIRTRIIPHRKHTLTAEELSELCNDIINTNISFNQLANKYKHPTIVARLNEEGYDRGSIRGVNQSALTDFKQFLISSGLFEYVQG